MPQERVFLRSQFGQRLRWRFVSGMRQGHRLRVQLKAQGREERAFPEAPGSAVGLGRSAVLIQCWILGSKNFLWTRLPDFESVISSEFNDILPVGDTVYDRRPAVVARMCFMKQNV
jgi:hypothetical protein